MVAALQALDCAPRTGRLRCRLAVSDDEVLASLRLRRRVFVDEMGAQVSGQGNDTESDGFDPYCLHLIVLDDARGEVVASTRVLTQAAARAAGGFYSAEEFEIEPILACSGRFMEIGRTCVHPGYRSGGAINTLWAGVSELIRRGGYDRLIGCASIDLANGMGRAHAVWQQLEGRHCLPVARRVAPRRALPACESAKSVRMPPLIKAYLRLGAQVGGPPCWDPAFGVADLFIHLDVGNMRARYARHFMRQRPDTGTHLAL